jgi:hypothetical protein
MTQPVPQTIKKPFIHKMIDVSTAHITEKDSELLKGEDCPICSYLFEYGYRVIPSSHPYRVIPSPDVDETEALKTYGFSEAFINLYKIARKKECEILLDCDGTEYEDLPTFEW